MNSSIFLVYSYYLQNVEISKKFPSKKFGNFD